MQGKGFRKKVVFGQVVSHQGHLSSRILLYILSAEGVISVGLEPYSRRMLSCHYNFWGKTVFLAKVAGDCLLGYLQSELEKLVQGTQEQPWLKDKIHYTSRTEATPSKTHAKHNMALLRKYLQILLNVISITWC